MKVAVITRHAISNYGSLLQAYATQKTIEKIGYNCEIIDYIREDESYINHEKTLLRKKANWYNNPLKRMIYLILRQPESVVSGKLFERERRKYLKLTKPYSSLKQLKTECPPADIYMTGSDQVWGPTEDGSYDPAYCLSFTPDNATRIAYAASFGRASMSNEVKKYYFDNLKRYSAVTVREDSAVMLAKSFGIIAEQVLDPTLLLTAEEWRMLSAKNKNGKYILIYQLHNDPNLGEYAKKVAKKKKLPLVRLSTHLHQIVRPGLFIWNPNIAEFLSYIDCAECLITDSFHGTAFAINLNTQFVEVLPNNSTGTRNQSILKLTGLENRILQDLDNIELADKKIEYDSVNKIIETEREKSINILKILMKGGSAQYENSM